MTGAQEWAGPVGRAWADEWRHTDRAFAPLTARLRATLAEMAPTTGRALDIGCGAGETAIALATLRPDLAVTGVDLSEDLIAVASARAATPNLAFTVGDAVMAAADAAPIDLFLSRHGVMFFDAPHAAFTTFRTAAAPGARLVFTCFRDWSLNRFASDFATLVDAGPPPAGQPGPFAFADEAAVRSLLTRAGWHDVRAEAIDYPFCAGEGPHAVASALAFLSRIGPAARALREAGEEERPRLREAIAEICRARLTGDRVDFPAAAWLWTAKGPQ